MCISDGDGLYVVPDFWLDIIIRNSGHTSDVLCEEWVVWQSEPCQVA